MRPLCIGVMEVNAFDAELLNIGLFACWQLVGIIDELPNQAVFDVVSKLHLVCDSALKAVPKKLVKTNCLDPATVPRPEEPLSVTLCYNLTSVDPNKCSLRNERLYMNTKSEFCLGWQVF